MADKMLDKLSKLLKQAEKAGTPEEAEAFMARAQFLATEHSIDLARARQHSAKKEQREQPIQKRIQIGEHRAGNLKHYCELFFAIADANDVKCDVARNSTWVIAFGMPSDIEVVETLYASIVFQMVEAANAWLKTGEYKKELVWRTVTKKDRWGYKWQEEEKLPMHGKTARGNFYDAFKSSIRRRLADARREAIQAIQKAADEAAKLEAEDDLDGFDDAEETPAPRPTISTSIVLRVKAEEVRNFHKKASLAKGTWHGSRNSHYSASSQTAGDNAGRSARLGGQKSIGGSRTSLAA